MIEGVKANLSNITITYCSICSGADKAHAFIQEVVQCLHECLPGLGFSMRQLFRCECNETCQRMLLLDDPETPLFMEAKDLCSGEAFDLVCQARRPVPKAMVVIAGIVCKQTTRLSPFRIRSHAPHAPADPFICCISWRFDIG